MRPTDGGPGGFEVVEFAAQDVTLAQAAPEDGVDKPGLRGKARLAGQFDRLVHRGVIGNAIQPEQLVQAEAKEDLQRGLLGAAIGATGDEPVKRPFPADTTENQLAAQPAIRRAERDGFQFGVEQALDEFAAAHAPTEDAEGDFSWFLNLHSVQYGARYPMDARFC